MNDVVGNQQLQSVNPQYSPATAYGYGENYNTKDYLPISLNQTEEDDISDLASSNESFLVVLRDKNDMTPVILSEIHNIFEGKIPRNFIINIRGRIGRRSGVFKSSFGMQLAMAIDPTFNLKERFAFTPNHLNRLVSKYATRKQVFMMDEYIHDTKISVMNRLRNIMESCREMQLCFILCGIPEQFAGYSDYTFERLGESNDSFLPKKSVYFMVKKSSEIMFNRSYRGIFKWNITPLSDNKWSSIWKEYSEMKSNHQLNATNQTLSGLDVRELIESMSKSELDFAKGLKRKELLPFLKLKFPDYTKEERDMLGLQVVYGDNLGKGDVDDGSSFRIDIDKERMEINKKNNNRNTTNTTNLRKPTKSNRKKSRKANKSH